MRFHAFTYWSPTHGCEVTRISLEAPGGEYYAIVPEQDGEAGRRAKAQASDMLEQAKARGLPAGQVKVR